MHTTVSRAPMERDQRVDGSEPASDRPGSAVRYQVFGPPAITVDGEVRGLSQRRERNVLAMLIAAHGRPVPAKRLIDQLWAGDPPAQARVSLQVAISRLRSVVEPRRDRGAPGRLLVRVAGGYVLTAQEDDVDVWRFDRQLRAAVAAEPRDRVAISEAALGVWRGTPYAD